ncbi:uncharacterized protein LOC726323 isoform X2 [Apis mellifera]|uniref:Uncharacterized protein LOC726323 isoform X2 n=1 Tax=Apis mellifera TaxID=7460 RepID=A0A7M7GR80_APIME|nr:uncharacterized protein LOC726323 isoform X2 [Apis mellifera]|eukprot:XP_006563633.2 uncharacterized protein LOC726323 isoform X2 [Apis mellifera]
MREAIVASISVVIFVGAMLCSSDGQVYMGTNWLRDLHENINALNRNLQQNMYQLQQRIHNTVQRNLEHAHRLTENLDSNSNMIQMIGGNSVIVTNNDGTKIVQSGRTSDGKPYIRESTDKIIGDTLRHIERIYDPITNTSKMHGYTLNLKDPSAKPVPLNDTV